MLTRSLSLIPPSRKALSLSDRGRVYHIIDAAAFSHGVPLSERFVDGFTHAMDGERDPRNLRLCFKIVPKVLSPLFRVRIPVCGV